MPTWRRLLVCLLWLALPLQGLAGSHPGLCGTGHGGMAASVTAGSTAGAGPAHAGNALAGLAEAPHPVAHHHAGMASASEGDTSDVARRAADPGPAAAQCSACASCCAPAALPPFAAAALPDAVPEATLAVHPLAGPLCFITGGPDRPPRAQLS